MNVEAGDNLTVAFDAQWLNTGKPNCMNSFTSNGYLGMLTIQHSN
jgi:hypothetical protein